MNYCSFRPLISIIVPVYKIEDKYLIPCIESVLWQTYENWELCLVDDNSGEGYNNIKSTFKKYSLRDSRIHCCIREENGGISECTNTALSMASGEFIALLDCDDVLSNNALEMVVKRLNENPNLDFIYSNEDKIDDPARVCYNHYFKPDWAPDTFLNQMYTSHLGVYRKSILEEIGGFRKEFDGAQDYDMVLRFTEKTDRISHIDHVLYHWRAKTGSTASDSDSKEYVFESAKRAKEEALKRRGIQGHAVFMEGMALFRMVYDADPAVISLIVLPNESPSFDLQSNWKEYIQGLLSSEDEIIYCTCGLKQAINCAKGDYIFFIREGTLIDTPQWRDILIGQANLKRTGACGVKSVTSDKKMLIQNGIACFNNKWIYIYAKGTNEYSYPFHLNMINKNVEAISMDCLFIKRSKFPNDESWIIKGDYIGSGIELCKRLSDKGLYHTLRNDVICIRKIDPNNIHSLIKTTVSPIRDRFYSRFLTIEPPVIPLPPQPKPIDKNESVLKKIWRFLKSIRDYFRENVEPYQNFTEGLKTFIFVDYDEWIRIAEKRIKRPFPRLIFKTRLSLVTENDISLPFANGVEVVKNISKAKGSHVMFLDRSMLLGKYALRHILFSIINNNPDIIYGDEDWIDKDKKKRFKPFFKPAFSPDTLLSYDYMQKACVFKRNLLDIEQKQGESIEDYLYRIKLKITKNPCSIKHIQRVLIHKIEGDKGTYELFNNVNDIKNKALKDRGINAKINNEVLSGISHVMYPYIGNLISIVIPSKDHPWLVRTCLESIDATMDNEKTEIILVDNGSTDENRAEYEKILEKRNGKYIYEPMEFNFSAMCNIGARAASGEIILFLNDDIEAFEKGWLSVMAGHVMQEHVGAVGAKLYYPGGDMIQHDGVFDSKYGPANQFFYAPDAGSIDNYRNRADMNMLAVTGACLMVRRDVFFKVGCFDETFPVTYNDVELGYRIHRHGYYNVLRNDVRLYHHESVSRGDDLMDEEKIARLVSDIARLRKAYPEFAANDPYYDMFAEENVFGTYHLNYRRITVYLKRHVYTKL